MKNKILLSTLMLLFSVAAFCQTIEINFEAVEKGTTDAVQIDSIYIENSARDTSTSLYYPNFLLTLCNDERVSSKPIGFVQNSHGIKSVYPNPFNEFANIIVNNPEAKDVRLSIYNLTGSLVAYYENYLDRGEHKFQITTQYPGMYLIYLNESQSSSHKVMSQTNGDNLNTIKYLGFDGADFSGTSNDLVLKSAFDDDCFEHQQGDTIMVEAYADCFSKVVEYFIPQTSETYVLEFELDDDIAPTLEITDDTIYLDENGSAVLSLADVVTNALDNCALSDTLISATTFDCSKVGAQNVDITLRDKAGNETILTAQITVKDIIKPILTTKAITVELDENGTVSVLAADVIESVSDNCYLADTSLSQTDFDCSDLGIQTINVTVTDSSENITVETVDITVEDNIAPVLTTKPYTAELDESGNATITPADVVEAASDNCSLADTSLSQSIFSCGDVGVQTINVTVIDSSENETEVAVDVTIVDNIAPTLTTKPVTIELDETGSASILAADVVEVADDNCYLADTILSQSVFNCTDLGVQTITVTVTDSSNNEIDVPVDVTVQDNIDPELTTKAITVELDENGSATVLNSDVVESASDNCYLADTTLSQSVFDCTDIGIQTINVTVSDSSENTATLTAEVTVEDKLAPLATPTNVTIELDATGNATITVDDVLTDYSDNCNISSIDFSQSSFDCADIGTITVTITLTDDSGNETEVTSDVTIEDKLAPTATPTDFTAVLDGTGNVTITANDVLTAFGDNCSTIVPVLSSSAFTCSDAGTTVTVTITLTDDSGNETEVTSDVTIADETGPAITTQNITVVLDKDNQATFTAADVVTSASDICGLQDTTLSVSSVSTPGNQVLTVDVTVTDVNGNPTTEQISVTVIDSITDVDGNKYDVVKIGDQVWMAENLRATSYSDATPIALVEDAGDWSTHAATDRAYCYYDNDAATHAATNGVLYTWAAAMNGAASVTTEPSGVQGVCPTGWHMPSDAEWETLATYISTDQGGLTQVGDDWTDLAPYLKSTSGWTVNADNGTNDYGFNAIPSGNRDQNGGYFLINASAIYWTATESDASNGVVRQIFQANFSKPTYLKKRGISVRCVMD